MSQTLKHLQKAKEAFLITLSKSLDSRDVIFTDGFSYNSKTTKIGDLSHEIVQGEQIKNIIYRDLYDKLLQAEQAKKNPLSEITDLVTPNASAITNFFTRLKSELEEVKNQLKAKDLVYSYSLSSSCHKLSELITDKLTSDLEKSLASELDSSPLEGKVDRITGIGALIAMYSRAESQKLAIQSCREYLKHKEVFIQDYQNLKPEKQLEDQAFYREVNWLEQLDRQVQAATQSSSSQASSQAHSDELVYPPDEVGYYHGLKFTPLHAEL